MIKIEKPFITSDDLYSTLQAYVTVDNDRQIIWFKVEKKWGPYLCSERADAFLIAVLNFAMRNKHDIVSEAPVSEDLYYNIDTYLIDGLVEYNSSFYRTHISASVASDALPCKGAVGAGISCGVDSLHALAKETNLKFLNHNITHLTFNNVGSHGEGERAERLYRERVIESKRFADEYGFEFIASDSNLMDVIKQSHFKTHTYSSMFAVFCLQKLFSIFYYASGGYKYHDFTLIDYPQLCCGSYELLSLPLFSTHQLRIYSEGENKSRLQKLRVVSEYLPSYKYLNVCLMQEHNCGVCEKCVRTLLELDALGVLERYGNVFDIDYYKKNKSWYLQQMLYRLVEKKHDYYELYPFFKGQVTLFMRLKALIYRLQVFIGVVIPDSIKQYSFYKRIKAVILYDKNK